MVGSTHGTREATWKPNIGVYHWMARRKAQVVLHGNGNTHEVSLPERTKTWVGGAQSRHLFLMLKDRFLGKAGSPAPLARLQRDGGISRLPSCFPWAHASAEVMTVKWAGTQPEP